MAAGWDIFCRVIDNFGDIGVSWRLARQLAAEHAVPVRLWVDNMQPLSRLCVEVDAQAPVQTVHGVELRQWPEPWQPVDAAEVVIEAFGCELPAPYIDAMAQRAKPSLWFNFEYLSAESWVDGCHALPSLQTNGLQKFFFFPGFNARTGGLLRETGLLERRLRWQQVPTERQAFLQRIGVSAAPDAKLISLFAYENAALASWLQVLSENEQPVHLLVPQGRIQTELQSWLGEGELAIGTAQLRGALTVQLLPFLDQENYDRLLWICDFNAVRGEDSLVRAQWAGRPLLWQPYVQADDTHLDKLEAFLSIYSEGLSPAANAALSTQWRAWNRGGDMREAWLEWQAVWPEMTLHAEKWCQQQAMHTNIAAALVQFYRNSV